MDRTAKERILASLKGIATGDAIGKQTETLSREGAAATAAAVSAAIDGSIAGAILGARRPDTVNDEWQAVVEQVNGHDLAPLAEDLSRLRC